MNTNYIYKIYRLQGYIRELMDHTYDYNCAMAMMQVIDPIPSEEQNAIVDFMNMHMDILVPAYHEGYEKLEQVVADLMSEK